jgi:hypothetical protein
MKVVQMEIAMHHNDVEQKRFVQNGFSSLQSSSGRMLSDSVAGGPPDSSASSSVSCWGENSRIGLVNLWGSSVKTSKMA